MYAGEGAEQLEAFAEALEERAAGRWPARQKRYYEGLRAGLEMAARAARKCAAKLRREQRKAAAQNAAYDGGDE